jgi:hypothetical protein
MDTINTEPAVAMKAPNPNGFDDGGEYEQNDRFPRPIGKKPVLPLPSFCRGRRRWLPTYRLG